MLNEIKRVFRQSMEAFRKEASTFEPQDQVAALLMAMRKEMVAAKAALPEYERSVAEGKVDLQRERDALAGCERRAEMAERIGDGETARIAREFADRHREKAAVLEQKVVAIEAELVLRRREVDDMLVRYKEADANRFALLAQLRAASSAQRRQSTFSAEDGAFADFARMEERMQDHANYVDALEDLEGRPEAEPSPSSSSVEERLEELKRRMEKG